MKSAKIKFGTWLFIIIFLVIIILLSVLTKNDGDMAKTILDIKSIFGK